MPLIENEEDFYTFKEAIQKVKEACPNDHPVRELRKAILSKKLTAYVRNTDGKDYPIDSSQFNARDRYWLNGKTGYVVRYVARDSYWPTKMRGPLLFCRKELDELCKKAAEGREPDSNDESDHEEIVAEASQAKLESRTTPPVVTAKKSDQESKPNEGADSTRGRPKGAGSFSKADEPLLVEMHEMISRQEAFSPTEAAGKLASKAQGPGTPESKAKRLVVRYKGKYGR
jgi:hypothetical protein